MKALLAILLLSLISYSAHGENPWITLGGISYHTSNRDKNYNEMNLGLGFEFQMTQTIRGTAGFYRNSHRNDSLYYGAVWLPLTYGRVKLGLAAELVSGYETKTNREPVKALLPVATVEWRNFGANLLFVPETKSNSGAVGLQFKVRW